MRLPNVRGAIVVLAVTAAVAAVPGRAPAPEIVFTGRVLDAADRAPLTGAQVSIEGTRHHATSDSHGRYTLTAPAGSVHGRRITLVAKLLGYETTRVDVVATSDTVHTDLLLDAAALQLESLVVTAAAPIQARVRVPMHAAIAAAGIAPERPTHPHPGIEWNTEAYDRIEENPFVAVEHNPLSTFSIDVDRASYGNIRRFLLRGVRPPRDAVRIEEMINYFPYDYPEPPVDQPFTITTDVAPAPWQPQHRLLRIGLQSQKVELHDLPPGNLVFLLDVSGSMQSPDKLPLVKRALRMLVNELRPQDRVAIVVYAGAAGLVLPPTPGDRKTEILNAIDRLEAGGSTAGGAGLRLAYDVAREHHIPDGNNRVILATDGDFNVGVSSDAEMIRLVEARRREGTFLTVLGFGTGNYKDSKLEKIADHGNGNYAYIDSLLEARKVLVSELGGTLFTVAKDVKLQIEFNPARVSAYRLIGYEDRLLAAEDFNDDEKDAGDLGAGHSVTALYEIIPVGVESDAEVRGVDSLRYSTPSRPSATAQAEELAFVKIRYKAPDAEESKLLERPIIDAARDLSGDFAFAAAVAGFGMLLRESPHRGTFTLDDIVALARHGLGPDPEGYRAGFLELVDSFRALTGEERLTAEGSR